MSSRAEYVGCAHEKCDKCSLPMPNSLFCHWLLFGVVWWIGWLKSEETRHIGNLTIYSLVTIPHLIVSTWRHQKLKTRVNSNSKISCLALTEKIWQIFHGHNPHTQLCCSSHKCMFLTNVAPFKKGNNLPNTNVLTFLCWVYYFAWMSAYDKTKCLYLCLDMIQFVKITPNLHLFPHKFP